VSVTRGNEKGQQTEDFLDGLPLSSKGTSTRLPRLMWSSSAPRGLTRAELKALRFALDGQGYSETNLRRAWHEQRTKIFPLQSSVLCVRQRSGETHFPPLDVRVKGAMQRILSRRQWTEVQRKWLKRFEEQLLR
jgi:type I restriction enzyme, R subunit